MTKVSDHKPELDDFTPAEIRVIAEYLLYTMSSAHGGARGKLMSTYPTFYKRLYPAWQGLPD